MPKLIQWEPIESLPAELMSAGKVYKALHCNLAVYCIETIPKYHNGHKKLCLWYWLPMPRFVMQLRHEMGSNDRRCYPNWLGYWDNPRGCFEVFCLQRKPSTILHVLQPLSHMLGLNPGSDQPNASWKTLENKACHRRMNIFYTGWFIIYMNVNYMW